MCISVTKSRVCFHGRTDQLLACLPCCHGIINLELSAWIARRRRIEGIRSWSEGGTGAEMQWSGRHLTELVPPPAWLLVVFSRP